MNCLDEAYMITQTDMRGGDGALDIDLGDRTSIAHSFEHANLYWLDSATTWMKREVLPFFARFLPVAWTVRYHLYFRHCESVFTKSTRLKYLEITKTIFQGAVCAHAFLHLVENESELYETWMILQWFQDVAKGFVTMVPHGECLYKAKQILEKTVSKKWFATMEFVACKERLLFLELTRKGTDSLDTWHKTIYEKPVPSIDPVKGTQECLMTIEFGQPEDAVESMMQVLVGLHSLSPDVDLVAQHAFAEIPDLRVVDAKSAREVVWEGLFFICMAHSMCQDPSVRKAPDSESVRYEQYDHADCVRELYLRGRAIQSCCTTISALLRPTAELKVR